MLTLLYPCKKNPLEKNYEVMNITDILMGTSLVSIPVENTLRKWVRIIAAAGTCILMVKEKILKLSILQLIFLNKTENS